MIAQSKIQHVYCWSQAKDERLPMELRVVNEGIAHGKLSIKCLLLLTKQIFLSKMIIIGFSVISTSYSRFDKLKNKIKLLHFSN